MLFLTPNQTIYLLTRDGDYGVERASVGLAHYTEDGAMLSIRDMESKGQTRYVEVKEKDSNAARVVMRDGDQYRSCYVSMQRDGQLGFDADKEFVMILRRNHMLACSFKPEWGEKIKKGGKWLGIFNPN